MLFLKPERRRSGALLSFACHTISDRSRLRLRDSAYLLRRSAKVIGRERAKRASVRALLPSAGAQSYAAACKPGACVRRRGPPPADCCRSGAAQGRLAVSPLGTATREEAMQVMFDSKTLPAAKRRQAWRDAICEIYLQVDCASEQNPDYEGFVREARFGGVTLTDTLISPQSVHRQSLHISHFDKDFYYVGIEHIGRVNIHQAGSSLPESCGPATDRRDYTTPTSPMSCAATSSRVNSGSNFLAKPSTAGSIPGGRRSSRISNPTPRPPGAAYRRRDSACDGSAVAEESCQRR